MELLDLLDRCQAKHTTDWARLPGGGPGGRLLTGFIDVAESKAPPALAALQADHRAVYVPDARLAITWGIDAGDWRQEQPPEPDWTPEEWSSVRLRWALVLLNGAYVWQVPYASVNWGAGIDGVLPWPRANYRMHRVAGLPPENQAWQTTEWEREFTRLLNKFSGSREFDFEANLGEVFTEVLDLHRVIAENQDV